MSNETFFRKIRAYSRLSEQAENDWAGLLEKKHYRKGAEFIAEQASIAQFLDRDTRPDFASTVMIPAMQTFISDPEDIDGLTTSIEEQKQSIFVD